MAHIWTLYNLTLHRKQICRGTRRPLPHTYTKTHTDFRLCRMGETSWCLSRPQMPASGEMVFSTDKTHAHTQRQTHTAFRAQQKRWVPMWILCSRAPVLISFILPLSVCLSLSLRRSEVCKIIHSSSLQSLHSLSSTHTQAGNTFVPSFIKKIEGFGG